MLRGSVGLFCTFNHAHLFPTLEFSNIMSADSRSRYGLSSEENQGHRKLRERERRQVRYPGPTRTVAFRKCGWRWKANVHLQPSMEHQRSVVLCTSNFSSLIFSHGGWRFRYVRDSGQSPGLCTKLKNGPYITRQF